MQQVKPQILLCILTKNQGQWEEGSLDSLRLTLRWLFLECRYIKATFEFHGAIGALSPTVSYKKLEMGGCLVKQRGEQLTSEISLASLL